MTNLRKSARKNSSASCANCFACRKGTELCPLEEHYDPDKAIQLIYQNLKINQKTNKTKS